MAQAARFPNVWLELAIDQQSPHEVNPPWVNFGSALRGASIRQGRSFELDRYEAGTMVARLAARDGALDPTNAGSVYAPGFNQYYRNKLVPMLQVRLGANYGGHARHKFVGYVEDFDIVRVGPRDLEIILHCVDGFALLQQARVSKYYPPAMTGQRVRHALDDAKWPNERRFIATGNVQMQGADYGDPQGGTAGTLEVIDDAVDAELGEFYIDGQGTATFWGHQRRTTRQVVNAIFGDDGDLRKNPGHLPLKSVRLQWSSREMKNSVTVSAQVPADVKDAAVQAAYKPHTASDSVNDTRYGPRVFTLTDLLLEQTTIAGKKLSASRIAQVYALFLLWVYKRPALRASELVISPAMDPRLWRQVIEREIGDLVAVRTKHPGGGGVSTPDNEFFIEAIAHEISGPYGWETTYELSPAARWRDFSSDDDGLGFVGNGSPAPDPGKLPTVGRVGKWPLGETSGLFKDTSGNGHDLTAQGTVTRGAAPGPADGDGGSVSLSGSASPASGGGSPSQMNLSGSVGGGFGGDRVPYTVGGWIRPTAHSTNAFRGLFGAGRGVFQVFLTPSGTDEFTLTIERGTKSVSGGKIMVATSLDWHLVVAAYDGTYIKGWIDGELVIKVEDTTSVGAWTGAVTLGMTDNNRIFSGYFGYFAGLMDEWFAFNRALTEDEVASVVGKPLPPQPATPPAAPSAKPPVRPPTPVGPTDPIFTPIGNPRRAYIVKAQGAQSVAKGAAWTQHIYDTVKADDAGFYSATWVLPLTGVDPAIAAAIRAKWAAGAMLHIPVGLGGRYFVQAAVGWDPWPTPSGGATFAEMELWAIREDGTIRILDRRASSEETPFFLDANEIGAPFGGYAVQLAEKTSILVVGRHNFNRIEQWTPQNYTVYPTGTLATGALNYLSLTRYE